MKKTSGGDPLLTILVLVATVLGLLAIWDAGYARAAVNGMIVPREFVFQAAFSVVAVAVGIICSRLPIDLVKKGAGWMMALSIIALILVEVPGIGKEIGGARRWIGLGQFTIQPAEFAKFTSIVFVSLLLANYRPVKDRVCKNWAETMDYKVVPKLKKMAPILWVGLVVFLIEKEPDLATAMVIVATTLAMLVLGGVRWRTIGAVVAVGVVLVGAMVMKEPYRLDRVTNHASRWSAENIDSIGYQTTQAEIAFAHGSWLGVGLGNGRAKHTLPAPTTDFILATIGEEFGLLGSIIVIGILAAITARLFWLGWQRKDKFARLALTGTAVWIGIQAATNVIMANGHWPPIGIPLPFFSYGGSSLIALWMSVGFCQAIIASRDVDEKPGEKPQNRTSVKSLPTPKSERPRVAASR